MQYAITLDRFDLALLFMSNYEPVYHIYSDKIIPVLVDAFSESVKFFEYKFFLASKLFPFFSK